MASITIHVDVIGGTFQLSGDTTELWSNRRARFFMTDYLNADRTSEQLITVPFQKDSETDRSKVLMEIQGMLEKYSFGELLTDESNKVLEDHLQEREKFKIFTQQARSIWNNEVNKADFAQFAQILKQRMTNRTLYHLQLLSAYHLAFSQNACNFSVPGSGKTSVVYAAYTFLKSLSRDDKKYVNKLLIIGPLSSFGPWEDEYVACFGEKADVQRLSSGVPRDQRIRHFLSPHSAEITLMTYSGVAGSLNDLIAYLRRFENRVMVVLDEAHRIKNTDGGVWAQSVLSIAKYCKSRVVLTGTPAPNGYEDIYNLYNFIWPDKEIIGFHLHQLKEMSANPRDSRIQALVERVHPFFIRINKRDLKQHMNLPDAFDHEPEFVEMGEVQRFIYRQIEDSYMDYFQQASRGQGFRSALLRARLIRLLQVVTNPALLKRPLDKFLHEATFSEFDTDEDEQADLEKKNIPNELFIDDSELMDRIVNYDQLETPSKFVKIKELVTALTSQGKKVIIWSIFIQTIKQLQRYLQSAGLASRLLIGEIPVDVENLSEEVETRESIIREFNSQRSSFNIIIANPSAVAESISLHKTCHDAIYLERTFNAAHFLQSKDRIHRVGNEKKDPVNYYYILSRSSIDETIHQRLKEKEQNMLRIIESREIPLINMNMDYEFDEKDETNDIKALIRDYVRRTAQDR